MDAGLGVGLCSTGGWIGCRIGVLIDVVLLFPLS